MQVINSFAFPDRYRIGVSDYPFSLMEGLAGDIIFEIDCFSPEYSEFPGYEI